jgi:hypothetical protein
MAQKLLTKAILDSLPPLYSQEHSKDPIVWAKFFAPWTSFTWFATEYSPEERTFFGWVEGHESELGYFNLDEMEAVRGPGGLKIERDMYFSPKPLSMIKAGHESEPYDLKSNETWQMTRVLGPKVKKHSKEKHLAHKSPSGLGETR